MATLVDESLVWLDWPIRADVGGHVTGLSQSRDSFRFREKESPRPGPRPLKGCCIEPKMFFGRTRPEIFSTLGAISSKPSKHIHHNLRDDLWLGCVSVSARVHMSVRVWVCTCVWERERERFNDLEGWIFKRATAEPFSKKTLLFSISSKNHNPYFEAKNSSIKRLLLLMMMLLLLSLMLLLILLLL